VRLVLLMVIGLAFGLIVSMASAAEDPTPAKTIQGEILRIDGVFYVVRDHAGQEVRVHVDDKTDRLDHAVLQVGDPVRVYVTPDGHATSIKHLGPAGRIEEEDVRKPGVAPSK
jgi:membrane protein implicated in regulation of membrane protease activity